MYHHVHHVVPALLIEHDDVGIVQKETCEGEALLFATRQCLVPGRIFLDLVVQIFEADLLPDGLDLI